MLPKRRRDRDKQKRHATPRTQLHRQRGDARTHTTHVATCNRCWATFCPQRHRGAVNSRVSAQAMGHPCTPLATWQGEGKQTRERARAHPAKRPAHVHSHRPRGRPSDVRGVHRAPSQGAAGGTKGENGLCALAGRSPFGQKACTPFSWACLQRPRNGASINAHHGANSKRWKRPRWGKRKRPRWGSVKAGALAEHRERPRWGHVETSALVAQRTCVHSKQIKHEHAREHTTRPHRNPTAQATPPSHPHPSPPTPAPTAHAHTRPRGA